MFVTMIPSSCLKFSSSARSSDLDSSAGSPVEALPGSESTASVHDCEPLNDMDEAPGKPCQRVARSSSIQLLEGWLRENSFYSSGAHRSAT